MAGGRLSHMDPLAAGLADDDDDDDDYDDEEEDGDEDRDDGKDKGGAQGATLPPAATGAESGQHDAAAAKRRAAVDLDALARHGYRGGPSVLLVPAAAEASPQSWTWGCGDRKESLAEAARVETPEEREQTRESATTGAEQAAARALAVRDESERLRAAAREEERQRRTAASATGAERGKGKESFHAKEKRKRDAGQASRGKSYVEEEKRVQRSFGVFSGFD